MEAWRRQARGDRNSECAWCAMRREKRAHSVDSRSLLLAPNERRSLIPIPSIAIKSPSIESPPPFLFSSTRHHEDLRSVRA